MRPKLHLFAVAFLILAEASGPAARAQDLIQSREGIALQNQINELRYRLDELKSEIPSGGSALGAAQPAGNHPKANDLTVELLDRVSLLSEELRGLRGEVETLRNQMDQQTAELNKKISDLQFQLQQAPKAAAPGKPLIGTLGTLPAGTAPAATAAPAVTPFSGTPEVVLKQGYAAFGRKDYAAAATAAKEILKNPGSPLGYDAQFLLAQALAGEKNWQEAALAYDDLYNRNKAGSHAPDALLGLAQSLTAINARNAACETLDSLRSQFPTPRPDLVQPIAAARQRAGCS